MSTDFAFHLSEEQMRATLDLIEHKKQMYPGHVWGLEVSMGLIPDGIGYEIRDVQAKVVSEDESQCTSVMVASSGEMPHAQN